jgi:hypothetical protein
MEYSVAQFAQRTNPPPRMKRLVWLLLFAVGTALAQVSPVDVRLVPEEPCPCCGGGGNCDMPDCGLPPAANHPVLQVSNPARVAGAVKGVTAVPRRAREKFYVRFLARARVAPAMSVHAAMPPSASVPLFREHCSLLI